MKCPACDGSLTRRLADDIEVDACDGGCGGIWFDNHELPKLDEAHEATGELLLGIERDEAITVNHAKPRHCPRCHDQAMMRNFSSPRQDIELDECPACGGVWLDAGELAQWRDQYRTPEQRDAEFRKFFARNFEGELTQMSNESESSARNADRFARMFSFLGRRAG